VSFEGRRPPVRAKAPELGQDNAHFGLPPPAPPREETP
jgi:hypothetical protein